jgi:hypothetical protein
MTAIIDINSLESKIIDRTSNKIPRTSATNTPIEWSLFLIKATMEKAIGIAANRVEKNANIDNNGWMNDIPSNTNNNKANNRARLPITDSGIHALFIIIHLADCKELSPDKNLQWQNLDTFSIA